MKNKLTLLGLLSFLSLSIFSQSWDLVPAEDKLNFLEDGQNIIQHTVWIDSTSVNNPTMVYHLNRVATCDNPPTDCLRNQAGLLGKEILIQNGQHRFGATANLTLIPNASLGTTWLYNSIDNITAEVVDIEETNVWGTIDSVKTIALSNLDTILLSKHWGLLSYPTGTNNYTAAGIDNLDLGKTVPDFFDIFDFEIGDIFYYENTSSSSQGGNGEIGSTSRSKLEILNKTVSPDGLDYMVRTLAHNYSWNSTGPPTTSYSDQEQTISFEYSVEHPANFYHRDLLVYSEEDNIGNGPFWALMYSSRDEQERYTKSIGIQADWDTFFGAGFIIDSTTDILQPDNGLDQFHATYKEGLGETKYVYSFFEVSESRELIGYIKDGVEVGEIIPDADLIVSANELAPPNALALYPNPTQDYIRIDLPTGNQNNGQWEIRNLAGKRLLSGPYNGKEISTTTLTAGIYLLTFTTGKKTYVEKIIKY